MIACDAILLGSVAAIVAVVLLWARCNRDPVTREMAHAKLESVSARHDRATQAQQEAITDLANSVQEHAGTATESCAYMEKLQREENEDVAPVGNKVKPA